MLEEELHVGDWVVIGLPHILNGFGGFIEYISPFDKQCLLVITTAPNGTPCASQGAYLWLPDDILINDNEPDLDGIELSNLIDLALDTKDVDWFKELSSVF